MSDEHKLPDLTESIKLGFETTKQLTTLNAGSIVVIGTFLSDIFPTDKQGALTVPLYIKLFIGAAFVGFGASLILAIMAMFSIRRWFQFYLETGGRDLANIENLPNIRTKLHLSPAFVLFSGGLICFGLAVLLNLFFGV
jgi:hypothetical protein